MTKKLYVIGNGFDLFHGLKTGYWNFKEYLEVNDNELLQNIEKYLQSHELWSNFEAVLEYLEADDVVDYCLNYLQDYVAEDWSDSGHHDYQYEVNKIIGSLTSDLKQRFQEWIRTISPKGDENGERAMIKKESLFFNFNYTNTLESLYLVKREDIFYIHGNINEVGSDIILGHGRDPSTLEQLDGEGDAESDIRLIEANRTINRYFIENYKNTIQIITENEKYFRCLANIEEVVVLGHSMSIVDMEYFREIVKNIDLDKVKWIVSFHFESEIEAKQGFLKNIGVKSDNVSFLRMNEIDTEQLPLF
ncbi:bacteriophage abortive infection AbiH family protein [Algoriphagus antarcticus]|uniref:Abortive infection AbiH-like protein n=1 Tax=Algoriphagus antarcticus TaxID=238540 RepID=A0A3E0E1Q8_9BACT|nr:bacteriophage abortive infection AbiH family protein [Algoriphagus antarcticus]REG92151.1 abortive infection AbiH-like protein [Algoriphagus antarcticus]